MPIVSYLIKKLCAFGQNKEKYKIILVLFCVVDEKTQKIFMHFSYEFQNELHLGEYWFGQI